MTKSEVQSLFGSQVSEVVWSENVDDLVPPGTTSFDVLVTSDPTVFLRATWWLGLGYVPGGPVLKAPQQHLQGTTTLFRGVPVSPGKVLGIVADNSLFGEHLPVHVTITPTGEGQSVTESKNDAAASKDPLTNLFSGFGKGLGTVVAIAAIGFIGFQLLKAKVLK